MENIDNLLLHYLRMNPESSDLGLYIHIPFCRKRCHFCAFYLTTPRQDRIQEYLLALKQEFSLYAINGQCRRHPVSTVYLGGGTPTSLEAAQLADIIADIKQNFSIRPSVEISVEADPETVNMESLQCLYDAGVNRLSLGLQTFQDSEWQQLGRLGKLESINQAVRHAKDIGLTNISIDLIYGLPGQTLQSWQRSLEKVVAFQPTHVSCYALTMEEGTKFYRDFTQGNVIGQDLELEIALQDCAVTFLQMAGYRQYEVSNFAKPGFECRHNLRYWSGLGYLGLGPSAQSYVSSMRFGNVADLKAYACSLDRGQLPVGDLDFLSMDEVMRERVIFGLRMNQGVPTYVLHQLEHDDYWQASLKRMLHVGFLWFDDHYLKTTPKGRRFIDTVALELL